MAQNLLFNWGVHTYILMHSKDLADYIHMWSCFSLRADSIRDPHKIVALESVVINVCGVNCFVFDWVLFYGNERSKQNFCKVHIHTLRHTLTVCINAGRWLYHLDFWTYSLNWPRYDDDVILTFTNHWQICPKFSPVSIMK